MATTPAPAGPTRVWPVVVALALAALNLAGCGSGAGASPVAGSPSAGASSGAASGAPSGSSSGGATPSSGTSPSASSSPTAGGPSASPTLSAKGLPRCAHVWRAGHRVPPAYKGCRRGSTPVPPTRLVCESGQTIVTFADHYYGVVHGRIHHTHKALEKDPTYRKNLNSCRA